MSTWMMEPGHTEAEFRARHMMVTWVRGLFKDIADGIGAPNGCHQEIGRATEKPGDLVKRVA